MSEIVLSRSEGRKVFFLGNEMTLKVVSRDTADHFSLCEFTVAAGFGGPPPHIHHGHDETFYVLDGTLKFQIGDREIDAPNGTFIYIPRGIGHTFWNTHDRPARLLGIFTPAGYENYFDDVARAFPSGLPDDRSKLIEIMANYDTVPAGSPPS